MTIEHDGEESLEGCYGVVVRTSTLKKLTLWNSDLGQNLQQALLLCETETT